MSKQNKLLLFLSLMCVAAVIFMIVALCIPEKAEFVPPSFDSNAIAGSPTVPDGQGYSEIYKDGMSFKVGICGKINVAGKTAEVYFTSVLENTVWLKVRFYDQDGNILGESGLIKPGEYLKSVELKRTPSESENIKLKIMSYEPETYKSVGTITLTPKIVVS